MSYDFASQRLFIQQPKIIVSSIWQRCIDFCFSCPDQKSIKNNYPKREMSFENIEIVDSSIEKLIRCCL